jgi:cell division protein FtsQ
MKLRKPIYRVAQLLAVTGMTIAMFVLTAANARKQDQVICRKVIVDIDQETGVGFLEESDISELLFRTLSDSLLRKPVATIPAGYIENIVSENPFVEHADVFIDTEGNLHISVYQRTPMVRIINKYGVHYYIDKKANKFPVNNKFTSRVPVVTGDISEGLQESDTISSEYLKNAYEIITYMNQSDLWKAQLEQLHVRPGGTFEMIPKLGDHSVVLGPAVSIEEKLEVLELFYREGLNYVGWDKYEKIDLTYLDQIVCTKKEWQ